MSARPPTHWSHERGQKAEDHVLAEFQRRGYRLIRRRWRCPFAEVDLLMASLSEYLLIEVKTLSRRGFPQTRLSWTQRERLQRARLYVETRTRADVRAVLAYVDSQNQILLFHLNGEGLE